MRSHRTCPRRAAWLAAALLLAGPGRLAAQEESGDGFTLELDPLVMGALVTDVDTGSAKFQEYRDLSEGAWFPLLALSGASADGNRTLRFLGENLSRDDGRYALRYDVSGRWSLGFDYNRIPHRFLGGAALWHTETAPGVFSIADPTQLAIQQAIERQRAVSPGSVAFPFLNGLVAPHLAAADRVQVELQRNRARLALELLEQGPLGLDLELTQESRTGARPYGAAFGFSNVTEIVEPIDYDTFGARLAGTWSGPRAGLEAGYRYSGFENHVDRLVYDNPFRATDATDPTAYLAPGAGSIGGAAAGRNALAPDNQAHALFASGRARIGERGWVNGRASYDILRQDEALLPYSTNSAIGPGSGAPFDVTEEDNLPVRSLDGDIRILHLGASAGTRLHRDVTIVGRVRRYDHDNRSPRIALPGYVRFDAVWEDIGRVTVPYEFTRTDLGVELGWTGLRSSRIGLAWDREMWDRTFREVSDTHEDLVRLTFDTRTIDQVSIRARYEHGERSIGTYRPEAQHASFHDPEAVTNLPALRKFDEAARSRDAGRLAVLWTPRDTVDVTVVLGAHRDDYDESRFGLVSDDGWTLNGELGWTPRTDLTLYAFAGRADRETFQRSRQSGATPSANPLDDWDLTLSETTDSLGAGIVAKLSARWSLDVAATWTRADGSSDFFSPPGGTPDRATGFDEYDDNEFLGLRGRLEYLLGERISASLGYTLEDYTADRFSREGLVPYMPGALLLAGDDGDYLAHLVFASLRLRI